MNFSGDENRLESRIMKLEKDMEFVRKALPATFLPEGLNKNDQYDFSDGYKKFSIWAGWKKCPFKHFKGAQASVRYPFVCGWGKYSEPDEESQYWWKDDDYQAIWLIKEEYLEEWRKWAMEAIDNDDLRENEDICADYYQYLPESAIEKECRSL